MVFICYPKCSTCKKAQAWLKARWPERYEVIFSNAVLLECTARHATKGGMVLRLAELLGVELPPDADYDTVNGMVLSCLPAIPRDGARLSVETCGLRIRVEEFRTRKVVRALVEKLPREEPPAAE